MITLTLDTNCLISLDEGRPGAEHVAGLLELHRSGKAQIGVPAVAASERQQSGSHLEHFDAFRARLARLGLADAQLLPAIGYYGIGFFGVGYYGGDDSMVSLEREIHGVLHPSIEFGLGDFCDRTNIAMETEHLPHKWLNAKCDVQALWSHIWQKRHCFVSSDRNYHKATKIPRLLDLGASAICTPSSAVEYVVARAGPV